MSVNQWPKFWPEAGRRGEASLVTVCRPTGDFRHIRVIGLLRCWTACDRDAADSMMELSRQAQVLRMGYD
ncbi:MAG: hypothetical protein LBJ65_18730 [Burkholderia sp.]|jgi:hypothetical protein|uniref:hypothetical protein n=1 Tax=Burkholderia sp. TaxID=36773 RepID=UPI00281710F2|nr:hypothetical protein [Burkholderia sp.]MDR0243636.1 hypothetical protein [Burkholderia sp.]